jgi:SOS-response transcriptional repressor LexA
VPNLGSRIKRMLKEKGMSQAELARLVGTKQQTISYIVSAEHPAETSRYSTKIAEVLGVNPAWLTTGQGSPHDPTVPVTVEGVIVRATLAPLLREADVPAYLQRENYENRGSVMTDRATLGKSFAIEIEGDSMAPRFKSGDVVVIDTSLKVEPGDYVCALLKAGPIAFRRYRSRHPSFELVPENADWDIILAGDVRQIVGVMCEHRSYRRQGSR